jgi:hypothetical protein
MPIMTRDRNVPGEGRLAGAIDDGPAANDDVVHRSRSSGAFSGKGHSTFNF